MFQMLIHQRKLYAVVINPMLIRIFVKSLCSALNLKTKQTELNFKIILLNIRNNRSLAVKHNRDSNFVILITQRHRKNSKPFWSECKPYFPKKNTHRDSKLTLIKKEKNTNNSNKITKKETLLINNDEIAKTFNKNFAETVDPLNTFEWPSNNY